MLLFLSFQDLPRVKTLSSGVLPRGVHSSAVVARGSVSLWLLPRVSLACLRSSRGRMRDETVVPVRIRGPSRDLTFVTDPLKDSRRVATEAPSASLEMTGDLRREVTFVRWSHVEKLIAMTENEESKGIVIIKRFK